MTDSPMVPFDAKDVTQEWIAQTFQKSSKEIIKANALTFRQESMHENGMLSSIFHANVEFEDASIGEKREQKVFVKIMPPDDLHRFIINNSFMDVTEIEVGSNVSWQCVQYNHA